MNPHRIHRHLQRLVRSRLALSTVVTTLIVLVVAVLLAGVVTYFSINVTSTRVQEESLALAKQHVWYDHANTKSQAAIMIINAGGRDVVVDKLTVRGQVCDWSKVYYNLTGDSISGDLTYNTTLIDGGTISVGGSNRVFKQATNDLTIQSGKTLIIYINNPDSISVNDIGLTVSVNIFTSQAMYYKETNVQGTGGTGGTTQGVVTSSTEILYASAYNVDAGEMVDIILVVKNTGSMDQTFDIESSIGNSDLCIADGVSFLYFCGSVTTVTDDLPVATKVSDEVTIQTYTLYQETGTVTIHAGETAIVYFMGVHPVFIEGFSAGSYAYVGIRFDSGLEVTKHLMVESFVYDG